MRRPPDDVSSLPPFGRIQELSAGLARHRHGSGYLAVVLEGGYVERSGRGRWRVECGDIVCHRPFEAHDDLQVLNGTRILNLDLPSTAGLPAVFTVDQPDDLRRLERGDGQALNELLRSPLAKERLRDDWTDELAFSLGLEPLRISCWSLERGLSSEHVSRRFRKAYGVTPAAYRLEAQVQKALELLDSSIERLADIAAAVGFADQAHMTRAVTAVTGMAPARWRKINSVQDCRF